MREEEKEEEGKNTQRTRIMKDVIEGIGETGVLHKMARIVMRKKGNDTGHDQNQDRRHLTDTDIRTHAVQDHLAEIVHGHRNHVESHIASLVILPLWKKYRHPGTVKGIPNRKKMKNMIQTPFL